MSKNFDEAVFLLAERRVGTRGKRRDTLASCLAGEDSTTEPQMQNVSPPGIESGCMGQWMIGASYPVSPTHRRRHCLEEISDWQLIAA